MLATSRPGLAPIWFQWSEGQVRKPTRDQVYLLYMAWGIPNTLIWLAIAGLDCQVLSQGNVYNLGKLANLAALHSHRQNPAQASVQLPKLWPCGRVE